MHNTGALIIRLGFWGPVYYTYNKEPPNKIVLVIIFALMVSISGSARQWSGNPVLRDRFCRQAPLAKAWAARGTRRGFESLEFRVKGLGFGELGLRFKFRI